MDSLPEWDTQFETGELDAWAGWYVAMYEPHFASGAVDQLRVWGRRGVPDHAARCAVELLRKGFEVFVPTRIVEERVASPRQRRGGNNAVGSASRGGKRTVRREAPFFPGYLFVQCGREEEATVGELQASLDVAGVLKGASTHPVAVPRAVMGWLFRIDSSVDPRPERKWDKWRAGYQLRVEEGVFSGFDAEFLGADGDENVNVLMDILGAIRIVSLPGSFVANK